MSDKENIAKNTAFLYLRMFLILGVTLFTSRVILEQLGISDFGIYSLVGGIVSMLSFFRGAMSNATRRYLSFDIGRKDYGKLSKTFSASLTIHFIIALIVFLLAETVGLWYIKNKLIFPENRTTAVMYVYQFSILTFIVNIIQVPYDALIQAREKMKTYAYISILEVALKLIIVYMLILFSYDKLIIFSILTFIVALVIRITYIIYCKNNFKESIYKFEYDKLYLKELLSFSGWSLFGNLAVVMRNQGSNIILNIFFGTIINAAYGITTQIQSAILLFVNNFQLAINPQIIKSYAQGDLNRNHLLIRQGSKFSFFLILLIILPFYFNVQYVLELWLKNVPNNTSTFVKLTLIFLVIDTISGSLMIGAQATGNIKWYQIIIGSILLLNLPISYLLLVRYNDPSIVFIVMIILSVLTLFFRLYFLKNIIELSIITFLRKVISPILIGSFLSIILAFSIKKYVNLKNEFLDFTIETILIVISSVIVFYFIGLSKNEKNLLKSLIKKYINK